MGWIYKITNQFNGKMYIGKTEDVDPEERWKEHQHDYKRHKMEKRPLYDAMNKYGVDSFIFQVIDEENDSEKLCQLERHYIEKYRTYIGFDDCNGYNATLGGDGKSYLNLDEKEVIRIHEENNYIAGRTAKHFNVDRDTIKKILANNGVKWLSTKEIIKFNFLQNYGGLVQLDDSMIINIFECPFKVFDYYPSYNRDTINLAYVGHAKNNRAYGYMWYRLSELPEKYYPLLDEYLFSNKQKLGTRYYEIIDFFTKLDADNLEIDDLILD